LGFMFKKNHPEDGQMLAKVILLLTEYRTVRYMHLKVEEEILRDWVKDIQFPPLFYEMWSSYL